MDKENERERERRERGRRCSPWLEEYGGGQWRLGNGGLGAGGELGLWGSREGFREVLKDGLEAQIRH